MQSIKELIRQRFFSEDALGARVVSAAGLAIEVKNTAQERTLLVFPKMGGLSVALKLDGAKSSVTVRDSASKDDAPIVAGHGRDWTFAAPTEAKALELYDQISRRLTTGGAFRRLRPVLVGLGVAVVAVLLMTPSAPATSAKLQAPQAPATAAAPASVSVPAQAKLTADEREKLGQLQGKFAAGGQGASYQVFSDPHCPFCKQLEGSMASVKNYTAVIMPLGYKDGSRDLSASVLCAADPAKEWAVVMATGRSAVKPCEAGYAKVDQNMHMFQALGLSSTPTMVTPKGTLVTGAASPAELTALLEQ